ncbi:hypothetical protein ISCGN_020452 [Ixodes scapularis]
MRILLRTRENGKVSVSKAKPPTRDRCLLACFGSACTHKVHWPGVIETKKFTLKEGQMKLLTVALIPSATRLRLVRTGDVSPVVITATFSKHVVGVVQQNLALRK